MKVFSALEFQSGVLKAKNTRLVWSFHEKIEKEAFETFAAGVPPFSLYFNSFIFPLHTHFFNDIINFH